MLADVLSSVKNTNQLSPIFTLNFVVANPNFEKIRNADKQKYFCESIEKTYEKTNCSNKVLSLVQEGIKQKIFLPQFHGRDHVNVPQWLTLLQNKPEFNLAFEHGIWGLSADVFPELRKSVQATYDSEDNAYTKQSIEEGLKLFETIFGFKSTSFIANNYIWSNTLNEILKKNQVNHFQCMKYQLLPMIEGEKRKKIRRRFGDVNEQGQTYAPRNCTFEPTERGDTHLHTINQIKRAFLYKKPAIISTHRINFVSGMEKSNRDANLAELSKLLKKIVHLWPDVQFVSSNQVREFIQ